MPAWRRDRAFSTDEAADLSGVHPSVLRDWVSTVATEFVSERRAGRRWYSAEDILVLRLANELVKGGAVTLLALAVAWEHCRNDPQPDTVLAVKPGNVATTGTIRCREATIPQWDSIQIIRLGEIAERTYAACEAAYR